MVPTLLGRDVLQKMLSPEGHLVIVNRSATDSDLKVIAAAIVRHDSTGPTRQILTELEIDGDESEWIAPPAPPSEPLVMIEVLLRLTLGARIVDVYLTTPTNASPAGDWEVGVRPLSTPSDPADMPIPELPGFAAYLVPFG
jgi:hypothetical protein